jgi:two-component system sensor kinase
VDLDALAKETFEEVREAAAGRPIQFSVAPLGRIEGDRSLLKQVFVNLLGNAVKYSRGRDPAVIEVGRREVEGKGTVFHVRDNGAGFDMKYADKLFGVFQRLHRAEEFEGTGVGLAIVQRIVARHGGEIWATSRPGEGAVFEFTLPGDAEPGVQARTQTTGT